MIRSLPPILLVVLPGLAAAAQVEVSGEVKHRFLKTGWASDSIAVVDKNGEVEWELPTGICMDAWRLPDDGVVYASDDKIIRLGADKAVRWEYAMEKEGANHACMPLPGGGFLAGLNVSADEHWAIELDQDGKKVKELRLEMTGVKDIEHAFRQFRKTTEGTYLGTVMKRNTTYEWDAAGKLLRTFPNGHFVAIRLPNGNTLTSGKPGKSDDDPQDFVAEFDKEGKLVWRFGRQDIDNLGLKVSMVCGLQRLPNGNTVITNTNHGRGHGDGDFPHVFEITPDKKQIVWRVNRTLWRNINVIQILDVEGDVHQGESLR